MRRAAVILAGGASRRMGVDKLALPRRAGAHETILEHVVYTALRAADVAWLLLAPTAAAKRNLLVAIPERAGQRVRWRADETAYAGPLAALAHAWPDVIASEGEQSELGDDLGTAQRWDVTAVFVLAGDLPGLCAAVLERLEAALAANPSTDAALVRRSGMLQPLVGCYRPAAGRVWKECWEAGEVRLMAALPRLQATVVDADAEGWPEWWTRPVHTPDDYRAWLDVIEHGTAPPGAAE